MRLFITITFLFSFSALSQVKMPAKWHTLNSLLNQEIKTILSVKNNRGPSLDYRLLELYSEKLYLTKEKENATFLAAKPQERKRRGKKSFFKKSEKDYRYAKSFGLKIIKNYPRTRHIPEIYFTLALNSRDFGTDKKIESFLLKSLRFSKKNSPMAHQALVSLSEHYYNDKKYKKAIRYFKRVVKNPGDEWLSKHHYNLSWCYFKSKKIEKAISHQKISYKLGKEKRYIDVSDQVLQSIGIFHIEGKKVNEGISFYQENLKNPIPYLLKMAKSAANKGKLKDVLLIIGEALASAAKLPDKSTLVDIRLTELNIYRNFKQYKRFFKVSKGLVKLYDLKLLKEDKLKDAITKIEGMVGYHQIQLAKNVKKGDVSYNSKKLKEVITYFNILSHINSPKKIHYAYFIGETYYSLEEYKKAFSSYKKSLSFWDEVKKKDYKIARKIVDSIFAILDFEVFNKKSQKKNTIWAFNQHIDIWPKDQKSRDIYQRLFWIYMGDKKVVESTDVLLRYHKGFPKDLKVQKELFTTILDHYIEKEDEKQLAHWISKMENGFLSMPKTYIKKATGILAGILFNDAKDSQKYISLYENEKYPKSVRGKSAFNASLLGLKQNNLAQVLPYFLASWKLLSTKEKNTLFESSFSMAVKLSRKGKVDDSLSMLKTLEKENCQKKKRIEKMAQFKFPLLLSEAMEQESQKYLEELSKCKVSKKVTKSLGSLYLEHVRDFFMKDEMERLISQGKLSQKEESLLLSPLIEEAWLSFSFKTVFSLKLTHKKNQKIISAMKKELALFEKLKAQVTRVSAVKFKLDEEKFDEKGFNTSLESLMRETQKLTELGNKLTSLGGPHTSFIAYHLVSKTNRESAEKILNVTPAGMPPEYVKGFKGQMKQIGGQLIKVAKQSIKAGRNSLEKSEVLSHSAKKLYDQLEGNI